MAFATLTDGQIVTLSRYVKGKTIHDLGAGDLVLANLLVKLGAERVIAIDKEFEAKLEHLPRVLPMCMTFAEYAAEFRKPIDVAFVSWPQNIPSAGLIQLIERARVIIYVGKATDGTMCGDPPLFWTLLSRTVLVYVPHRWNVLTVYGDECALRKKLTGDELGGITQTAGRILSFEEAEAVPWE